MSPLRGTRRLKKKKKNGISKVVEENKIETRNCLLFFDTLSFRKNKTLNSDTNKTEIKEHATLLLFLSFKVIKLLNLDLFTILLLLEGPGLPRY